MPDKQALIRLVVLLIAFINQAVVMAGMEPLPVDDAQAEGIINSAYELGSYIFTVVVSLWSYWKNNSFTYAAKQGDKRMAEIKARQKESKQ